MIGTELASGSFISTPRMKPPSQQTVNKVVTRRRQRMVAQHGWESVVRRHWQPKRVDVVARHAINCGLMNWQFISKPTKQPPSQQKACQEETESRQQKVLRSKRGAVACKSINTSKGTKP